MYINSLSKRLITSAGRWSWFRDLGVTVTLLTLTNWLSSRFPSFSLSLSLALTIKLSFFLFYTYHSTINFIIIIILSIYYDIISLGKQRPRGSTIHTIYPFYNNFNNIAISTYIYKLYTIYKQNIIFL